MRPAGWLVLVVILASSLFAQSPALELKIEEVMTPRDMQVTGISTLTTTQRRALDEWLGRYTTKVMEVALHSQTRGPEAVSKKSGCSPTVESNIAGEIEGWDGETVFKLDNGQVWEQAEYAYTYFYAFRPAVTIYPTNSGCRMKVEDEEETVLVRRIK